MIKIFKNLTKKDVLYLAIAICLIIFQVFLDLRMPDYTANLSQAVQSNNLKMNYILENGFKMLLCAFFSMVAAISVGFFSSHIAANFARTLRNKLFDKITNFSEEEINYFQTSSLITRTTNDVMQMQQLIAMGLQMLIKAPILAIWAMCKISSKSIEWTTATLITVGVIIVAVAFVVLNVFPKFKKIQTLTDNMNNAIRENIEGVRVIRAFNAEDYQNAKFNKINKEVTKINLFTSRVSGILNPVMTIGMNVLTISIYWIGAILINKADGVNKAVVFGEMTAFTSYALQIVMAFMMLIMLFIIMPRAMVSAKRINEVLDKEIRIKYKDNNIVTSLNGEIEFKNVSFAYNNGNNFLTNINFKIKKGETFAIIGATGSGKTTLINLIPRFYDVTDGEVLVDGINVKDYPKEELNKKISLATQKAVLFKGKVKDNISYGDKDINQDKINEVLKISQADFILDLEDGINANVAQGGTNFSGGQKQRLSIARALYKESEIIIFDDTFSALDYKTDMIIRKEIKNKLKDKTVVIVAQRIGTIKNADQILVLDDGKVAGLGTHKELINNCAVYKEIALSQLSKEEL